MAQPFYTDRVKKKLKAIAKQKAQALAKAVTDDMECEWLTIVDNFYNDLNPFLYVRHADRVWTSGLYRKVGDGRPGLYKTYDRYNEESTSKCYGGIYINSKKMYTDYGEPESMRTGLDLRESGETVLACFLEGWHGNYFAVSGYSHYVPSEELKKMYEKIYRKYKKGCSA